ncbi:MAG TPA: TIGR03790 family protein [Gemmataceae bacterium]|nr:TIGR03790 family protein [Gemmataceae bacterium]
MTGPRLLVGALVLTALACPARALGPADVFVIYNKNVPASREVADHYAQKREVPADNLIGLDLPAGEDISRADYDKRLLHPLRDALKDRKDKVKVLLTVYGVPLRVGRSEPTDDEKAESAKLSPLVEYYHAKLRALDTEIKALEVKSKDAPPLPERKAEREAVQGLLRPLETRRQLLTHAESEAAVDSELSLLWWEHYELRRWQLNLLYFQVPEKMREGKEPVVMVSRLDGPSVAIAKGLVDQAVEVEKKGLEGKAYFDARGIRFDPKGDTGHGYGGYDESLREAAKLLRETAKMDVVLDDRPELFAEGSCPDCALYCGWYSLMKYVPCLKPVRGAVAYHIASGEAVSLRDAKSRQWCKCLLEDGVAATLGPVAEPYTFGFPKPAEFFGYLVTGKYTLVECYWKTSLFTSWMTVLVGDPLYNPYMKNPKMDESKVEPSPKGGKFPVR